jgi:hypothetical protein
MLKQYSRNSSEKKFQSHDSVMRVRPGGSGGRHTLCEIEPESVVKPRPVEMSPSREPSVGRVPPSEPSTRPSPSTFQPGTLAASPASVSKPVFRMSPVFLDTSARPSIVKATGGDPPSVSPGVNASPVVMPARSFVNRSRPRALAKLDCT